MAAGLSGVERNVSIEDRMQILIVEDDPDSRELLSELLEAEFPGAKVRSAGSAEEALTLVARHRPAVVVTDLTLPGMDGIALCRRLKSQEPAPGMVLVTGQPDVEGAELFDALLAKPLDIEDLTAAVRLAFGRADATELPSPTP